MLKKDQILRKDPILAVLAKIVARALHARTIHDWHEGPTNTLISTIGAFHHSIDLDHATSRAAAGEDLCRLTAAAPPVICSKVRSALAKTWQHGGYLKTF